MIIQPQLQQAGHFLHEKTMLFVQILLFISCFFYLFFWLFTGCTIITNCDARFVLPNFDYPHTASKSRKSEKCSGGDSGGQHMHRRWRVYLYETPFITTDFVIIAAGVLGTTNLLLQSKIRGLAISARLAMDSVAMVIMLPLFVGLMLPPRVTL
ncbi:hypothetical protein L7F22_057927 [Adiantum nelumboides]|nr:hypothetical protein [Adiantum nelumboides]